METKGTTMTIKEFVRCNNIKISCDYVAERKDVECKDAYHYKCRLTRRGKDGKRHSMTFLYSQGYGISGEPTAEGTLECLVSDASCLRESFEDWASDLGYSEDSIKAQNVYKLCKKSASKLYNFLGNELVGELQSVEF
jgi:hypothetical protein